jgi:LPS export ABC transporter protein LptC
MGSQPKRSSQSRTIVPWGSALLGLGLAWGLGSGLGSCVRPSPPKPLPTKTGGASFGQVTFTQANPQGKPTWTLKGQQANYSKGTKQALISQPRGMFFADGQGIYDLVAKSGQAQNDGKTFLLQGGVTSRDLRNGSVLKGDEAEWRPEEKLLILKGNVSGTRNDLQISGTEGRYFSALDQVHLKGGPIVAILAKQRLRLTTTQLTWSVNGQKLRSDQPVNGEQFSLKDAKVLTGRAKSKTLDSDLATQIVSLSGQANLQFIKPALDITSELIHWNIAQNKADSPGPLTVVNRTDALTTKANQGTIDLTPNIVTLTGSVESIATVRQSKLNADRLVWALNSQQMQAQGNVRYIQTQPPFDVTGPSATGNLATQDVVVTGNPTQPTTLILTP